MTKKSFILALILTAIPGLGLIYVEKKSWGIIALVISVFSILICFTGILAIIGIPLYALTAFVTGVATVWSVLRYPGGWKWL